MKIKPLKKTGAYKSPPLKKPKKPRPLRKTSKMATGAINRIIKKKAVLK